MFNTMVVGDLFEETDDWVNDEGPKHSHRLRI